MTKNSGSLQTTNHSPKWLLLGSKVLPKSRRTRWTSWKTFIHLLFFIRKSVCKSPKCTLSCLKCIFIHLSIYPFIHPFIYPFIYLSIHLSIYLIHLSHNFLDTAIPGRPHCPTTLRRCMRWANARAHPGPTSLDGFNVEIPTTKPWFRLGDV